MIIVSQDKEVIINFNNISNINIEKNYNESIEENDITSDIYAYAVASGMIRIGRYKTEERAKEVLQEMGRFYEIAKRYESSGNTGITLYLEDRFVYQMPADVIEDVIETDDDLPF